MKKTGVDNVSIWMPCPKVETEHPGLAYICPLDELIVMKQKDDLHDIIGTPGDSYTISNKEGQKIFLAVYKKHCRKFDLKIFNIYGNEVIQVKKPKYCLSRIFVWAPPGNFVGSIAKGKSCKIYWVKNKYGEVVLKLQPKGFFHVEYHVMDNGDHIGVVAPEWKLATVLNMKTFGVSFPIDMNIEYKAVLLGACFLLVS